MFMLCNGNVTSLFLQRTYIVKINRRKNKLIYYNMLVKKLDVDYPFETRESKVILTEEH